MKNKHGFTLIEMLIASTILVIVGMIGVAGLQGSVRFQKSADQKKEQLAEAQVTTMLLTRDLRQISKFNPMIDIQYLNNQLSFTFNRMGYVNPFYTQKRSTLQRVQYALVDGVLIRTSWDMALNQLSESPYTQVLMHHVNSLTIKFIDENRNIFIPTATNLNQEAVKLLAVEVTINAYNLGDIKRLILLPGS